MNEIFSSDENAVIEENMGLVTLIAGKMAKESDEFDDLVQEGIIGLLEAHRKFKPELGWSFSTYAYNYIKGYMYNSKRFFDHGFPLRLPAAWDYESRNRYRSLSLNFVADDGTCLAECVEDPASSADNLEYFELHESLKILNEKEQFVINSIFFEKMTLKQVGEILGVTTERARQIKEKAFKKLRKNLNKTGWRK